jgi:hypothetical protein
MGSKRQDYKSYDELLTNIIKNNNIKTIVEPFCGSGITSAYLYDTFGNTLQYHLNDIDTNLVNFLTDMKNEDYDIYYDRMNEIKKTYNDLPDDNKIRYNYVRTLGNLSNDEYDFFIKRRYCPIHAYRKMPMGEYDFKNKRFNKYSKFIQSENTIITNEDFNKIIEKYKNDDTALLIYDPPYFMSDNTDYCGYNSSEDCDNNIIDNTKLFVDIIKNFKDKNKTFYIINKTALIDYLMGQYKIGEYAKMYSVSHKKTIHNIYSNVNI